jgi:hypothetical protein
MKMADGEVWEKYTGLVCASHTYEIIQEVPAGIALQLAVRENDCWGVCGWKLFSDVVNRHWLIELTRELHSQSLCLKQLLMCGKVTIYCSYTVHLTWLGGTTALQCVTVSYFVTGLFWTYHLYMVQAKTWTLVPSWIKILVADLPWPISDAEFLRNKLHTTMLLKMWCLEARTEM